MKQKLLLFSMLLLLSVGTSFSQTPTFDLKMLNWARVSATEVQVDIYICRTGTTAFELSGLQMGILYNDEIRNGMPLPSITTSWVAGSPNAAFASAGVMPTFINSGLVPGIIRCAGHVPSGGPGSGPIISNVAPGTRVGRLSFVNSILWAQVIGTFSWCNVTVPYKTKVSAYIAEVNTDITADNNGLGTGNTMAGFSTAPDVLPVELSTLTSTAQGRSVVLNWTTKTEKNSNRFEVERSLASNSAWSTVGTVKAADLSNSTKYYNYTDNKLQSGKYQYRLKMVDNDGTFEYSVVTETEVALPKDFSLSQNYPNPFNPTTKIDYQVPVDAKILMEVYNVAGQKVAEIVNQNQVAGYYTIDFGSAKLSSGVYVYRISAQENATGKSFSSIKKMMLLK